MAAHNITFTENIVRNNRQVGLNIEGTTNGTVIRGNTIECDDPKDAGIRFGEKARDVTLDDNRIKAVKPLLDERRRR